MGGVCEGRGGWAGGGGLWAPSALTASPRPAADCVDRHHWTVSFVCSTSGAAVYRRVILIVVM